MAYMAPPTLARRFPAQADQVRLARREVEAYAREHGAVDPAGIALAVSEAVTNAVIHAYVDRPAPGDVEVLVERHPDDGLEIRVCDEGRGMMPRSDSPGLGVGLPLVAKLAQRFRVETRPTGGTAVSMVFPVRDPA
jgi:serine/threonine-protein kinase RsbW